MRFLCKELKFGLSKKSNREKVYWFLGHRVESSPFRHFEKFVTHAVRFHTNNGLTEAKREDKSNTLKRSKRTDQT